MFLVALAFSMLLSGHDAYVNACSSQGETRKTCACQADFLALNLSDEKILQLAVAGSNALNGKTDKMKEVMQTSPEIVVALKKLEKEAVACRAE